MKTSILILLLLCACTSPTQPSNPVLGMWKTGGGLGYDPVIDLTSMTTATVTQVGQIVAADSVSVIPYTYNSGGTNVYVEWRLDSLKWIAEFDVTGRGLTLGFFQGDGLLQYCNFYRPN